MTIILELAPELEARLRLKAQSEGQDITAYLHFLVERETGDEGSEQEDTEEEPEGSAYDLFAEHIGRIHSGGQGRWSEDTGEKFAAGMEEKRRQGHL